EGPFERMVFAIIVHVAAFVRPDDVQPAEACGLHDPPDLRGEYCDRIIAEFALAALPAALAAEACFGDLLRERSGVRGLKALEVVDHGREHTSKKFFKSSMPFSVWETSGCHWTP